MVLEHTHEILVLQHITAAGKTTCTERVLFYSGVVHKIGEVHDEMPLLIGWNRKKRGITITLLQSHVDGQLLMDFSLVLTTVTTIDTPGHVDFTAEVERSLRVLMEQSVSLHLLKGCNLSQKRFGGKWINIMSRVWFY